jgi:addiction module HigA family antidote
MSQTELAKRIGVPFQRVNEIVRERRGVTPETALRLSKLFGTTPDLWMNMQANVDLYRAIQSDTEERALRKIRPLTAA